MLAGQGGCHVACGHGPRAAGWSHGAGHRVPGPHLPQRLRADAAGGRPGPDVPARSPWHADRLPGGVRADRHPLPPGGGPVRREQRHPGDQVQEGHPEGRGHGTAAAVGRPGRQAPRGGDRLGARVPVVWTARKRDTDPAKPPQFSFAKTERRVTCYYFYVWDQFWGPGFIKVCAYFPYPVKVWLNGHEHAKQAAARAGIGFTELSNGFASADDPDGLQLICDRLGPADIQAFFDRWAAVIPVPFTPADRAAGYWWELSLRQVEASRTLVFDAPRQARAFFEALIADNLDLGRPENVEVLFKRSPRGRKPNDQAGGVFKTAIDRRCDGVTINAFWRHSRVKQYLKDSRALRIETVVNSPDDLGCQRRLPNLPDLQARARAVNARLLHTEKAGQGCVFD